nr:hypothetical protein [Thetidibacter halocola]
MILVLPLLIPLAACDTTTAAVAGGAALGAALDDDKPIRGAVVGAAAGVIAGSLIERYSDGTCLYRDPQTGETYRARC